MPGRSPRPVRSTPRTFWREKAALVEWIEGARTPQQLIGRAVPTLQKWENLDLHWQRVARIDYAKCIGCNLCYIACEDGAHQSIRWERVPTPDFLRENGCQTQVLRSGGVEGIERAIADRRILRTWLMRGTIHFVAAADVLVEGGATELRIIFPDGKSCDLPQFKFDLGRMIIS